MIKVIKIEFPDEQELEDYLNELESKGNTIIAVSSGMTNFFQFPIARVIYRTKRKKQ